MLTPVEICALLYVYAYPEEILAPIAMWRLIDKGLILPTTETAIKTRYAEEFKLTERGQVMVDVLTRLPLPSAQIEMRKRWAIKGVDLKATSWEQL